MYKNVMFDLDGTVSDNKPVFHRACDKTRIQIKDSSFGQGFH